MRLRPGGKRPPGPRGTLISGSDRDLRRSPLPFLREMHARYGNVVRLRTVWPMEWYLLSHPSHLEHILAGAFEDFPKAVFGRLVGLATGQGLLALDGSPWQHDRRLMQPSFHRPRIAALVPPMVRATEVCEREWEQAANDGRAIDIFAEMMRLALRIGGVTLFSRDVSDAAGPIATSMRAALDEIHERLMYPFYLRVPVPTPKRIARLRATRRLDTNVADIIRARRETPGHEDDLLALLLQARDADTGTALTEEQLHGEVRTLLVAGHETSAAALAWCWLLIAQHPEVEARLHEEFAQVLGGRAPSLADVSSLTYTRNVIQEALRLYPPAPWLGRVPTTDQEFDGYDIPARSLVTSSIWVVHRHPDFWEDPDRFDPDRFTPERSAGRPRFAYLPFGAGPRQCLGVHFAMTEVAVALAVLGQRFRVRLRANSAVTEELAASLRPRRGILMTLERRGSTGPATTRAGHRGADLPARDATVAGL